MAVNSERVLVKAVILAGGLGTRLREETEFRPKPMVEIGGRPVLWHIMKILSTQGINEFVICLGYKGDQIKDFFLNYEARTNDITVKIGAGKSTVQHSSNNSENWSVTLVDTGVSTLTGARLYQTSKYIGADRFLCTYGDGLADLRVSELLNFHQNHGKIATVTGVRPVSRFGSMQIDNKGTVTEFVEKPLVEKWINGGFFIFEPEIFDYLDPSSSLEKEPLEKLVAKGELKTFKHEGFWQPMDTYRESKELNELWDSNQAPWKIW